MRRVPTREELSGAYVLRRLSGHGLQPAQDAPEVLQAAAERVLRLAERMQRPGRVPGWLTPAPGTAEAREMVAAALYVGGLLEEQDGPLPGSTERGVYLGDVLLVFSVGTSMLGQVELIRWGDVTDRRVRLGRLDLGVMQLIVVAAQEMEVVS